MQNWLCSTEKNGHQGYLRNKCLNVISGTTDPNLKLFDTNVPHNAYQNYTNGSAHKLITGLEGLMED